VNSELVVVPLLQASHAQERDIQLPCLISQQVSNHYGYTSWWSSASIH